MKTQKEESDEFYNLLIRIIALLNGGNIDNIKTLRVLAHSEKAMLSVNASLQQTKAAQFLCESHPGGLTIHIENLKLEDVYYCHIAPLIRFHVQRKTVLPSKINLATQVWPERNMDVIERAEKGSVVIIATTPTIRSLFIKNRPVKKFPDGTEIVDRGDGKEFMLWHPTPEALQKWQRTIPTLPPLDLVDEMHRVWKQSFERN